MLKYDFNNNNAIVDLPSIWKIGNGKISFITASGTDIADIPDNGEFTILVGNIDSIHIGGTEHWGYNKNIITLGNSESVEDNIYVDTITVSPSEADWCKCEKVGNKLVYTPIEANPTTEPRYAYFRHSTSDTYIKSGDNAGLFAAPEWWVTVKQLGSQHAGARPENLTDNTNPYIGGNGNIGEVEDFIQVHTPGENTNVTPNNGNSSSGNEGGSSSGNNGSSSSNSGNEGNNENLGGNENQGGNTTPSGETYRSGVANITIVNNSSYYFDNSHTVSANNDTIDLQLVALAKVYVNSGSLSINLSIRENSLSSDLTLDSGNNPPCRFISSGFTLSPMESKSILNVHWEVNSNDSNDYVPSSGLPIASTKHTLYIGNGYYSTSGSNGLGIVTISVSGENGYFKDGGNYTITIN